MQLAFNHVNPLKPQDFDCLCRDFVTFDEVYFMTRKIKKKCHGKC